jgi:exosome complex component RRP42
MNLSNLTIETLKKMFSEDKRFDGRKTSDFRDLSISYEVSNKAEGSARVKLGKTEVIAGIKLQIGAPYPDSPEKGNLMVSGDMLPLASPRFEHGPPQFPAIEIPRLVDRAIRESGMIKMKDLVITPKEKVWTVIIDLYPINADGNLIDAFTIAAIAALKNTKMPEVDKDGKIDHDKPAKTPLPLSDETYPFSFSFFKLGNSIYLDPTREEEEAAETRITFGVSKWNKQHMISSCQKAGIAPVSKSEIDLMMKLLPKKFDELNERLKKYF